MPRIVFIECDGTRREVEAPAGRTVLDIAQEQGIDIEGACEGGMSCATCHVIVDPADFGRLDPPSEEEADMLDFALGLTATSRLGCQIVLSEALDGLTVRLPRAVHNLLDG